jgi:hypothetical protein
MPRDYNAQTEADRRYLETLAGKLVKDFRIDVTRARALVDAVAVTARKPLQTRGEVQQ